MLMLFVPWHENGHISTDLRFKPSIICLGRPDFIHSVLLGPFSASRHVLLALL